MVSTSFNSSKDGFKFGKTGVAYWGVETGLVNLPFLVGFILSDLRGISLISAFVGFLTARFELELSNAGCFATITGGLLI